MAIACVYCNGEHVSPAQIRQCWNDNGQLEIPLDVGGLPGDGFAEATAAAESDPQHRSTHSHESRAAVQARSMQGAGIELQHFHGELLLPKPGPTLWHGMPLCGPAMTSPDRGQMPNG